MRSPTGEALALDAEPRGEGHTGPRRRDTLPCSRWAGSWGRGHLGKQDGRHACVERVQSSDGVLLSVTGSQVVLVSRGVRPCLS